MARNDWELVDEDEVELVDEVEEDEDEEQDERDGRPRNTCGDRVLTEDQRRRWYDDATDPEELTGLLSW